MHSSTVVVFASVLCLLALTPASGLDEDFYLKEAQGFCTSSKDSFSCGKYKLLRYLDGASKDGVLITNTSSTLQLVKIDGGDQKAESFFPEAERSLSGEGEFGKFFKFVQRRADRFLRTQGLSVPIPDWFTIVEDSNPDTSVARKHPKKKGIMSLLTLFGLFKVKVISVLILLGVFFIKKVILLSALILPSILHNIKMSCKHMVPYHAGHAHAEDFHDESSYYGNYGHSGHTGYNKDWERRYKTRAATGTAANQGAEY